MTDLTDSERRILLACITSMQVACTRMDLSDASGDPDLIDLDDIGEAVLRGLIEQFRG